MRPTTSPIHRIIALLFVAACCGCGRAPEFSFAPVEGVVTRGGKPVAGLGITFFPEGEGPRAMAWTDASGRYKLRSMDGHDGAMVGQHRVCLNLPSAQGTTPPAQPTGSVPAKASPGAGGAPTPEYGTPGTTPLRAEVRPAAPDGSHQTIDFQIP